MAGGGSARVRRRGTAGGFTLIEAAVAIVVLAIGITAVMMTIGAATRLAGAGEEYATAAALAQDRHAEVVAELAAQAGQSSVGDQQGDFGDEHPGFAWHQQIEATGVPDVERVTITITWPNGNRQRTARFVTYERIPQQATQ